MKTLFKIILPAVALLVAPMFHSCLSDDDETIILEGKLANKLPDNNNQEENQENNQEENQEENQENNQEENPEEVEPEIIFVPGEGEGILRAVPEEIVEKLKNYMPIYEGNNPPIVEGYYYIDPMVTVYCEDEGKGGFKPGQMIVSHTLHITNQDINGGKADYEGWEGSYSSFEGKGSFVSGSGNNFTLYFDTDASMKSDSGHIVTATLALIISGTKTPTGIKNIRYAFTLVNKENDLYNEYMKTGVYRIFKDKDDMAEIALYDEEDLYVDLGLPSGTLWGTCNLGAINAWGNGDYYAWGETITKDSYTWSNYQHGYDPYKLIKYCSNYSFGYNNYTDNLVTIEPADDAAYQTLGDKWAIPSNEDWKELTENCNFAWQDNYLGSGTKGYLVTSKTDDTKYIFLPASTGYYSLLKISLIYYGSEYWTSTLNQSNPAYTYIFSLDASEAILAKGYRANGRVIRPIRR